MSIRHSRCRVAFSIRLLGSGSVRARQRVMGHRTWEDGMKREPITLISSVVTLVQALIPLLLAFGLVQLTKEQTGAITSAVVAWGGLLGTVFGRNLVTPVADTKDNQGKPLKASA